MNGGSLKCIIGRTRSISRLDVEGCKNETMTGDAYDVRRCKPVVGLERLPGQNSFCKNIVFLSYRIIGLPGKSP